MHSCGAGASGIGAYGNGEAGDAHWANAGCPANGGVQTAIQSMMDNMERGQQEPMAIKGTMEGLLAVSIRLNTCIIDQHLRNIRQLSRFDDFVTEIGSLDFDFLFCVETRRSCMEGTW